LGKFLNTVSDELTLYARQHAWLDAPPKPPENAKGKKNANQPTRREQYESKGSDVPLPELAAAEYLWAFLGSMGVTEPGPHGPSVLAWPTIEGWQRCNGLRLRAWESRAIRSASGGYVGEYFAAQDPTRAAPWLSQQSIDRDRVADSIRGVFSARAAKRDKPAGA
jgi:hypothetical protein